MSSSPRRFRMLCAGAAMLGTAVIAVAGCAMSETGLLVGQSTMPAKSEMSATVSMPAATDAKLEALGVNQLSPVYWLGENGDNVFLYREFLPLKDEGDPVVTSVKHMLEAAPEDKDYFNCWSPAKRIGATISANNEITVDISSDAFARPVDKGLAERSIQQLVYTATAAAANSGLLTGKQEPSVSIVVDGRSGYVAWGAVTLDRPLKRNQRMRAPLWIIDPAEGSQSGTKVKTFGVTSRFTGGSFYQISPVENGKATNPVAKGIIAAPNELPKDSEFHIENTLAPGTYELLVWGQNKGSKDHIATDSKTFTVK